jgi:hypothetical protein
MPVLTGAALIREREHGTIEHLLVIPVTPVEIMLSKIWSMGLVVLLVSSLALVVVVQGFLALPIQGSLWLFVLATALFLCAMTSLGIALATVLHPEAEDKPVVIGNYQAGWQVMMTAAIRPELLGPIVIAGSPLSYWSGERGKNPVRYAGGLLGGSWLGGGRRKREMNSGWGTWKLKRKRRRRRRQLLPDRP